MGGEQHADSVSKYKILYKAIYNLTNDMKASIVGTNLLPAHHEAIKGPRAQSKLRTNARSVCICLVMSIFVSRTHFYIRYSAPFQLVKTLFCTQFLRD